MASHFGRWFITLILCICLGWVGAHRFFTKNYLYGLVFPVLTFGSHYVKAFAISVFGTGLISQIMTYGGLVWVLVIIDLVLIITGNYKDGNGARLVR